MSLHYILDGYNIIKCTDALADDPLEQGRGKLIRIINEQRPQGSPRNDVTIVFDGKGDVWGAQSGGCAKVVFTSGESADEYIKRAVEDSRDRANIVAVSNDKGITFYVRTLGAKTVGVEDFLSSCHYPSNRKGTDRNHKTRKVINPSLERKINQEFEKIWLEKDKDNLG